MLRKKIDKKEIEEFSERYELFLPKEKRRGLSLEETHIVIRGLQGQVLTLLEASIEGERLKAMKDIVNSYFSEAQSRAQDYDWGKYDDCCGLVPKKTKK